METKVLSEEEIKQILDQVSHKLESGQMQVKNVEGRVLTVVDDEISKRSGGAMISRKEQPESSYMGTYYNMEEFLKALNDYISDPKPEMTTVTKKGKVQLDQNAINQALHDFSSFTVEKTQKKKAQENAANMYVVSRNDNNSDEIKRTGGLITPHTMEVTEGRYVDEQAARAIAESLTIEIPTIDEIEDAIEQIDKKEPVTTSFTKKTIPERLKQMIQEKKDQITTVLLIPIMAYTIKAPLKTIEKPIEDPTPPPITQIDDNIDPSPTPVIPKDIIDEIAKEEGEKNPEIDSTRSLENGDIVEMKNGMIYDHNSQADDGISGVIGENPYREEGDYTVDVIAIVDANTGNIIDYTGEIDGNLEDLLEKNQYTKQDIRDGKIVIRYNVTEGISSDLNRSDAAGWVTYDPDTYHDKGNAIQQAYEENNLKQGGKTI